MLLEICTPTLESVEAAVAGGADRIELCENLGVGGITPSLELIKAVKDNFDINVQVLIRPRAGDFEFNKAEIQQIVDQIEAVKTMKVTGVVVGALNADLSINEAACKQFKTAADHLEISFHKAIDEASNKEEAIAQLIDLGFDRILTSGGKPTALEGLNVLTRWRSKFGDRIQIMPGGSIRPENVNAFTTGGFPAIHSAAIKSGGKHSDAALVLKMASALA